MPRLESVHFVHEIAVALFPQIIGDEMLNDGIDSFAPRIGQLLKRFDQFMAHVNC